MDKLLIGTSNKGKIDEILSVFDGLDFEFLVDGKDGVLLDHNVVEDGESYEENAQKKAEHYFSQMGVLTVSEDSGIVVDALKGELGLKTRRWGAGEDATDKEWIDYFLNVLKDVPDEKRTARMVCVACVKTVNGDVRFFKGVVEGVLTRELRAPIHRGLPVSSCFIPEGFSDVHSNLLVEEKNLVSHRGKAMRLVRGFLVEGE